MGRRKGARNELHARDRLRDRGYTVHKSADTMNSTDIFDLADLVAMKPGEPVLFVQVKTNQARGKNALEDRAEDLFPHENADLELWVRHDGVNSAKPAAWREFEYTEDGFEKMLDERGEKW